MPAGWAECCALVGVLWWPALVVGCATYAAALHRARTSLDESAVLVESLVDTHGRVLAESLGVPPPSGRITSAEGAVIDDVLHKGD